MFKMSHLSIALQSTEKPYTFQFKDTSLESIPLKLHWKVNIFITSFDLIDLFSINKQVTINAI